MLMNENAALSVSELNEYVRKLLAGDVLLRDVFVTGEISGYKHHVSGHRYFALKDRDARVQCVMFRQNAFGLDFRPEDGMRVRVRASASLFPRDGSYQLYVSSMQKQGVGDLYLKFEELKKRLAAEGLFDPAIKREIPMMPRTIGIVTSRTGAAIRDMIRVARRRNPNVGVLVAPCAVQGTDAAGEIVRAIELLNRDGRADVILAGRGGGSIEDLWAFNEEIVARAIAASRIPIISCVGHETDFTIADFVADVRAATPSMAAEIAVPVTADLRRALQREMQRIRSGMLQSCRLRCLRLERLLMAPTLRDPQKALIESRRQTLLFLGQSVETSMHRRLEATANRLARLASKLDALDPQGVMDRGYAYVRDKDGLITRASDALPGMQVEIHFRDGSVAARILNEEERKLCENDG